VALLDDLRVRLETEENETVGGSFGSKVAAKRKSFSVPAIRDWLIGSAPYGTKNEFEAALLRASQLFDADVLTVLVGSLLRFSFLIELTNLKLGSTKMKTRWLSGRILMPQPGSFEPVEGEFRPGTDPRAATFDTCVGVFVRLCNVICDAHDAGESPGQLLLRLNATRRVPYEIPATYAVAQEEPVHTVENVIWSPSEDVEWLIEARSILRGVSGALAKPIREIEKKKLQVKVFKTDRALTGKDKTNRAKRWEVLAGDFQHATIHECWSVERKLTADLVFFIGFPDSIKSEFLARGLVGEETPDTRCPVTLEPLDYEDFSKTLLDPAHGVSDYQVGHLHPLKRGGRHTGTNVCWQSANGNRIQGDLSIEETHGLLQAIEARRNEV